MDLELLFEESGGSPSDNKPDLWQALVDSLRVQIPSFGLALTGSMGRNGLIDPGTLSYARKLALWLHGRSLEVYHDLERHQTDDGQPQPGDIVQPDWKTVR